MIFVAIICWECEERTSENCVLNKLNRITKFSLFLFLFFELTDSW